MLSLGVFCYNLLKTNGMGILSVGMSRILWILGFFTVTVAGIFAGKSHLDFVLIPILIMVFLATFRLDLPKKMEKCSRFLGRLSYPIYLTHISVIYFLKNFCPDGAPLLLIGSLFIGTIMASILCLKAGDWISKKRLCFRIVRSIENE